MFPTDHTSSYALPRFLAGPEADAVRPADFERSLGVLTCFDFIGKPGLVISWQVRARLLDLWRNGELNEGEAWWPPSKSSMSQHVEVEGGNKQHLRSDRYLFMEARALHGHGQSG